MDAPDNSSILDTFLSTNLSQTDFALVITIIVLLLLAVVQKIHSFPRRSPSVPLKVLPRRPALQILFKPDDDFVGGTLGHTATKAVSINDTEQSAEDGISLFSEDATSFFRGESPSKSNNGIGEEPEAITHSKSSSTTTCSLREKDEHGIKSLSSTHSERYSENKIDAHHQVKTYSKQEPSHHKKSILYGLPDSFAPLLSSSEMQVLTSNLTADLIHTVQIQANIRLKEGRHFLPLDKNELRPQFWLDSVRSSDEHNDNNEMEGVSKGCRISASVNIGSQNFSQDQDLDTRQPTASRSRPMVKNAELILDPPLRIGNVVPTLLNFPNLFEDTLWLSRLRNMPSIVGVFMELLTTLWFIIEKLLWIIERHCQIHLSKVKAVPIYRRVGEEDDRKTTQWRLSLSFTGYLLFFEWIPIPFINFRLPTFIIPQPHALLEYLLTPQPLASAKLHRENIAEDKLVIAALSTLDTWSTNVKAVVTPSALEVDLTLPGGITVAVEMMHGREVIQYGAIKQSGVHHPPTLIGRSIRRENSDETLSTWFTPHPVNNVYYNDTTFDKNSGRTSPHILYDSSHSRLMSSNSLVCPPNSSKSFDANSLVPWLFEVSVDGSMSKDKIVLNIPFCRASHLDSEKPMSSKSILALTGSFVVCRTQSANAVSDRRPVPSRPTLHKRAVSSNFHLNALSDSLPIHALILYPEKYVPTSKRMSNHMLEYDFEIDVDEETRLDAISLSYGASHPMLKGGTIISCVLESIYAYGTIFAREGATLDPSEKLRKRNILRHLPAVEFTAGIENFYLPKQSTSYLDDGNTRSIPEMDGGRVMFRIMGGIDEEMLGENSPKLESANVQEGIKVIANFGVSTFSSKSETNVKEFPELDIVEGSKLCSFILGTFDGSVMCHLRPQSVSKTLSSTGPNIFNPLEAYEIDFSGSLISLRLKESSFNLGHRRVIVPTETTFSVKVLKSVVNMSFEGTSQCELAWDFQGSSPMLQVTKFGEIPAQSAHENRQQVPLLINDLCQGRLNLDVSSVGGISFTRASTSREDKQGLYDWKFFNALVCPDEDSPTRIRDVLYDKKTMYQLLSIAKLLNSDLERGLSYILTQLWRAKEIFDQEGISDPGHAIPGHKLARLVSLFLCGDTSEVDQILPIIRRVVAGNGLDVVGVKELLRKHVEAYDEWTAEIDRGVKWAAVALGPMIITQPFVETEQPPLSESISESVYDGIPTAKSLYDVLQDKPQLPLDTSFSNLVCRIAPYLTFRQVSYVLNARPSSHWQPFDLKRIRYVYTIKKKVQEISESYGGLSFMPQSFFVSIFLGEATRSSLRAPSKTTVDVKSDFKDAEKNASMIDKRTFLSKLRRRRLGESCRVAEDDNDLFIMSPAAGRIASMSDFSNLLIQSKNTHPTVAHQESTTLDDLLGDSLLGPQDVAVLLQAGLTSAMKGSAVVQLNQRMLLDLMASQPRLFATAVLAELGIGGSRALTSALMAFLEMDQSSFKSAHRIDMHSLLESWLPGIKIPRREDYLAGGRWARQSYYDAMFGVAVSILDLAEIYNGLKLRIQRVRHHKEKDPLPLPKQLMNTTTSGSNLGHEEYQDKTCSKLMSSIQRATIKISEADELGKKAFDDLKRTGKSTKESSLCAEATFAYKEAFAACKHVLSIDKLAFQADWFKSFYRRNYDALMVQSIYGNIINDIDSVRVWMEALRRGSMGISLAGYDSNPTPDDFDLAMTKVLSLVPMPPPVSPRQGSVSFITKPFFTSPETQKEQDLIDAIIEAIFYDPSERDFIKNDPLVRLLIQNDPGQYNFTLITAMGVITEGKKGMELQKAIERLEQERGVVTIRSDTGTARSFDYNASKIEEAVELAIKLKRPYGIVGYSQGCANEIHFESMMLSGTPDQQKIITSQESGMVCRQLLFSAANGSIHGPAGENKIHQLITMSEDFFKYQQGYFSRAFIAFTLEVVNDVLDSAAFQKFMGGMQGFFPDYLRAFWREAQHLPHIPTCVLRGVLEPHTTPESLDMISNQLSKQSGCALHDSQVHVYDAVGHPIYVKNRNMRILKNTDMGGAIQRTHHWSPLCEEVEYVKTNRDVQQASFDCAKDRHIFPFVDVNARFGIISYVSTNSIDNETKGTPLKIPMVSTPTKPFHTNNCSV